MGQWPRFQSLYLEEHDVRWSSATSEFLKFHGRSDSSYGHSALLLAGLVLIQGHPKNWKGALSTRKKTNDAGGKESNMPITVYYHAFRYLVSPNDTTYYRSPLRSSVCRLSR